MTGGSLIRKIRAWGRRHSYSFFSSLGALLKHRIGTLMTVLVLGIAIVLPLGLHTALANLSRLDLRHDDWGSLSVFLQPDAAQAQAETLQKALEGRSDVAAVKAVSPSEGMEEFQKQTGFGLALDALEANPLPWVLVVTPQIQGTAQVEQRLAALQQYIEVQPAVDSVQYDLLWVQRLGRILDLGSALALVLTLLFAVAVIVVVSNTIRLDVAARAEEIEIFALVGAGNSFIRQPFLYSGFWYGLLGGLIALILLNLALIYLDGPLTRLLNSYGQQMTIYGPGPAATAGILGASALLGLLGAWVSVQRYLRMLRVGGSLGRR